MGFDADFIVIGTSIEGIFYHKLMEIVLRIYVLNSSVADLAESIFLVYQIQVGMGQLKTTFSPRAPNLTSLVKLVNLIWIF